MLLARRYLRPKRTFVSVITLISIIGVMLGVAVLIIVLSVMSGFDKELRDKILGFKGHLKVTHYRSNMRDQAEAMKTISANPRVKAVAPYILDQVLVETQPTDGESSFFSQYLRGADPKLEEKVSVLKNSVTNGAFDLRGNRILVGVGLAGSLSLSPGDPLSIYSRRDLRKMKETRNKEGQEGVLPDEFKISGIFDVGYYEYNSAFIVTSIANAQDLCDLGSAVSGLMVVLRDPYEVDLARKELSKTLEGDFVITTWLEENSTFLDALVVEKNMMFYLLFFIMIVAAFGITSAQITFVVQKTREIGMLKALGATSGQIMWVFLSQSLVVGVAGVASGFGLGMLAVAYRNEFLRFMRNALRMELFPASVYNFSQLPATIVARDIVLICGGSLVICVLAGLLPAWNAGRLKPVEALRHE